MLLLFHFHQRFGQLQILPEFIECLQLLTDQIRLELLFQFIVFQFHIGFGQQTIQRVDYIVAKLDDRGKSVVRTSEFTNLFTVKKSVNKCAHLIEFRLVGYRFRNCVLTISAYSVGVSLFGGCSESIMQTSESSIDCNSSISVASKNMKTVKLLFKRNSLLTAEIKRKARI